VKIALVLPYFAQRLGGPVTVAKSLGKVLVSMGNEVSYWAPGDEEARIEARDYPNAHIFPVKRPRSWFRSPELARALDAAMDGIDIVDISEIYPHSTLVASRIARSHGKPYVVGPKGTLEPWRVASTPLKWLKKRLYMTLIGNRILARAACVIANSREEAENLERMGIPSPIAMNPHGVDADYYRPAHDLSPFQQWPELGQWRVALFLSRLSREKGLDLLIPAFADLAREGFAHGWALVLAGPDDRGYESVVRKMVSEHRLNDRVFFTGMLQGARKLSLYQRADVFVLPSYSENFGLVVAEAMACGKPVVTTTGTPWSILNKIHAGHCVKPERHAIAHALRHLMGLSATDRAAIGQKGRIYALKKLSWEVKGRQLQELFQAIVKQEPLPHLYDHRK